VSPEVWVAPPCLRGRLPILDAVAKLRRLGASKLVRGRVNLFEPVARVRKPSGQIGILRKSLAPLFASMRRTTTITRVIRLCTVTPPF